MRTNTRDCSAFGRRLSYYNTKRIPDERGRIKCPVCNRLTRIVDGLFVRHYKLNRYGQ